MAKKTTNTNKGNNHFSPQTMEHKKTTTYAVGNLVLAWDKQKNVAGLIRLMESQLSS